MDLHNNSLLVHSLKKIPNELDMKLYLNEKLDSILREEEIRISGKMEEGMSSAFDPAPVKIHACLQFFTCVTKNHLKSRMHAYGLNIVIEEGEGERGRRSNYGLPSVFSHIKDDPQILVEMAGEKDLDIEDDSEDIRPMKKSTIKSGHIEVCYNFAYRKETVMATFNIVCIHVGTRDL
ncbi:hypothetical protein ACJX0J_007446, partial [Zea mays]